MSNNSTHNNLELEVSDFGPIVEAKLDLRPLTVFVGPSNTGKSYLAILIYSLQRYFSDLALPYGRRRSYRTLWGAWGPDVESLTEEIKNALVEMARHRIGNADTSPKRDLIAIPAPVLDFIRSGFDELGNKIRDEISRSFGSTNKIGPLIRRGSRKRARVVFRRRSPEDLRPVEQRLALSPNRTEFRTTISTGNQILVDLKKNRGVAHLLDRMALMLTDNRQDSDRGFDRILVPQLVDSLARSTLSNVVGPLQLPAFYLPADRTGVMHSHSAVVSAVLGSASMAGLRPTARTAMLSGVLSDFLQQLIELDSPRYRRPGRGRDLGKQIEDTILGGSINVEKSKLIDYPHFTYRPEGWKEHLPLMRASSMVSELAPVVLYLRHMVRRDSVLIIEEPESHLHPEMQVKFTRLLAAMVRLGIRVIVTTHSEWILEELSNLVLASKVSKARRKELPNEGAALASNKVGTWLFKRKKRPKGSIVTELELEQSGLFSSSFDSVSAATHNDWARIADLIEGGA